MPASRDLTASSIGGGTCQRSCSPGPWSGPDGTPRLPETSSRARSWSSRRNDLIDEYRLYVHPVVIGQGKRLFEASDITIDLRLAETRTFGNGVVLLRYRRLDPGRGLPVVT